MPVFSYLNKRRGTTLWGIDVWVRGRRIRERNIPTQELAEARFAQATGTSKPAARAVLKQSESKHRVYFLRAENGLIKIGYSEHLNRRLESIRMSSPVPLELLLDIDGGRDAELELHDRFAELRAHGEWFRSTPELLAYIEGLGVYERRRLRRLADATGQPTMLDEKQPRLGPSAKMPWTAVAQVG